MPLDPHEHLERMLTRLKLTAIRDQLDNLIDEAGRSELTIREALTMFCEREIARKDHRRIDMSFGLARFPFVRNLSGFDFEAQPSIDKAQIRELCTGRFVANGEAVLLLGPPGVGKSHLAVAIGREVIIAGYTVLFIPAVTLVAALAKAHAEGKLEDKLSQLAKPKLARPLHRHRSPSPPHTRNDDPAVTQLFPDGELRAKPGRGVSGLGGGLSGRSPPASGSRRW